MIVSLLPYHIFPNKVDIRACGVSIILVRSIDGYMLLPNVMATGPTLSKSSGVNGLGILAVVYWKLKPRPFKL